MKKELQQAIRSYRPEAEIRDFQDVSGHANDTFLVELEDEKVVCTFCTSEDGARSCRKEVKIPQIVADRTEVPVPEILYSDCKAEPPFYITRKVEGEKCQEVLENRVSEEKQLNHEQKKSLFRNIGRMMGELHSTFQFSGAGEITVRDEIKVEDPKPQKRYIREQLQSKLEKLDPERLPCEEKEFEQLIPKIVGRIEESQNVLVHWDIRPDNMVVDGTEIKALFDFERSLSCHPALDYAYSERHLVYPHKYFKNIYRPETGKLRELQEALKSSYATKIDTGDNWRKQVEIFKLIDPILGTNSDKPFAEIAGWSEEKRDQDEKQTRKIFREKREKLGL